MVRPDFHPQAKVPMHYMRVLVSGRGSQAQFAAEDPASCHEAKAGRKGPRRVGVEILPHLPSLVADATEVSLRGKVNAEDLDRVELRAGDDASP